MQAPAFRMRRKKVVQTEVDPATDARRRHIADRRSIPLKDLVREELRSYAAGSRETSRRTLPSR